MQKDSLKYRRTSDYLQCSSQFALNRALVAICQYFAWLVEESHASAHANAKKKVKDHAAFRANDFTKPPTYDFTSICSIFKDITSVDSSRIGEVFLIQPVIGL